MSEKVKFYRGDSWDRDAQNEAALQDKGEIVFVNAAFGKAVGTEDYETSREFGSIYQDDKIVGTTKASELRLTEPLTVVGTNVGNITIGKTLEKGMSIEEILRMMLQKEVGIIANKPTMTGFNVTPNSAVEVGTDLTVTLSATYNDGNYTSENTEFWNPGTISAKCPLNSTVWTYNGTEISGSTYKFNAVEGDNKFVVTMNYGTSGVTSVKNNLNEDVSVSIESGQLTNNKSIKAYKKYFYGSISDSNTSADVITSDIIRGFSSALFDGTSETISSFIVPANSIGVLVCPSNKSITQIANAMSINYSTSDYSSLFAKSNGVVKTISDAGSGTYDVKVYVITNIGTDSTEYKNIKFN